MLFSGCPTFSDQETWNEDHIAGLPLSFTAFIHASSCCLSASNEPLTTGCTTLTGGWVTIFRPTGGTDG
jgi:hypothetical protein